MIQRCRDMCPLRMMCRCVRVSPSGYYGWVTRPPSGRAQENARLLTRIRQLHADQDGVVGSPRIWEDLRYAGEPCGHHRVARLMRRAGLHGVPQRRPWRKNPVGGSSDWGSESSGPKLQCGSPQHQMGHRYYLRAHGRALAVPLHRAGCVFGPRGGLSDEAASEPLAGRPSRTDGVMAATRAHPGHFALGSGLPVYLGGVPTVPGSAAGHRQYECGGEWCGQCRRGALLRRAQTGTGEPATLPDKSRGQSGYLRLHRALSQSAAAAETRHAATEGTTLNSTVRDIGIEPDRF